MSIVFPKVTTREELQNRPVQMRMTALMNIAEHIAKRVEQEALILGRTSFLMETTSPQLTGQVGISALREEEIVIVLQARLPGCDIEFVTEWIDLPTLRGEPPMRMLKKGYRIDWS